MVLYLFIVDSKSVACCLKLWKTFYLEKACLFFVLNGRMKEARLNKQTEGASEILSWVSKSRKLEEKKNTEKEKALQLSRIFEEQVIVFFFIFPFLISKL